MDTPYGLQNEDLQFRGRRGRTHFACSLFQRTFDRFCSQGAFGQVFGLFLVFLRTSLISRAVTSRSSLAFYIFRRFTCCIAGPTNSCLLHFYCGFLTTEMGRYIRGHSTLVLYFPNVRIASKAPTPNTATVKAPTV